MLAVRRDTQAAIKTIAFEAHESNWSEETQLSSHRPCPPTCPATHTGQVRRHPRCYHRMHRETFNYIHHVTAWRRMVIRTSKSAPQTTIVKKHARTTACGNLRPQSWDIELHTPRHCLAYNGHQNVEKYSADHNCGTFSLAHVRFATVPGNFSTVEHQQMLRGPQFFNILTFKCAFRHSGVQFFDIWTSKSGPNLRCFVHFDLQMCFSPQLRTIFQHLNFQKWSRIVSFLTFWLSNVHFATAAYNFSASELPKVVPDRQFFNIFTSECAFRHSGVQFFDIWTSKSGPNLRCFVHFDLRMCFSPQRRAIFDVTSQHLPPHPPL